MLSVRQAGPRDTALLRQVLALAADWRPDAPPRPVDEVLAPAEVAHYAPDWTRPGDRGLVAVDVQHGDVGAVWWHVFRADDPGYGFVAPDVPEVTLGVLPGHRGRGVGSLLLRELVDLARDAGLPALSLSVEPDNPAARLYARNGFVQIGTNQGSLTMVRALGATGQQ